VRFLLSRAEDWAVSTNAITSLAVSHKIYNTQLGLIISPRFCMFFQSEPYRLLNSIHKSRFLRNYSIRTCNILVSTNYLNQSYMHTNRLTEERITMTTLIDFISIAHTHEREYFFDDEAREIVHNFFEISQANMYAAALAKN
jgi:hypothetical protein